MNHGSRFDTDDPPASVRGLCAPGIETTATTTVLLLEDGRRFAIDGLPDHAAARRCARSLNRIGSIRLDGSAAQVSARLRGIGHRLPVDLAVPVGVALALIDAGIPAIVSLDDEVIA